MRSGNFQSTPKTPTPRGSASNPRPGVGPASPGRPGLKPLPGNAGLRSVRREFSRFPPPSAHTALMRKRVHIALAVLLVALAGVSAWQGLSLREPVYQGKRLSVWLKAYRESAWLDSEVVIHEHWEAPGQKADEVVRQAGTDALPTLLWMLEAKDSALKVKFMGLVTRQHIVKIDYIPAENLNSEALHGFWVLGAKAQSSVPALIEIANRNRNVSLVSQCCAISALGFIGPSAKEAVPSLLRWATSADWQLRWGAIFALGRIRAEQDRVLPVLINALHDPSSTVQASAVGALKDFGPDAKIAVPALVQFLNASHDDVNKFNTANALKAIDPEAADEAGVK